MKDNHPSPPDSRHIAPLLQGEAELTHNHEPTGPIVLSTRIRLARNLAHTPFPGWAKETQRVEILRRCLEALQSLSQLKDGIVLKTTDLSMLEKQILLERHLISRELMSARHAAGVCISNDQSLSVMVNEEDHLRIQAVRTGLRLEEVWNLINQLDTALERRLEYAFSERIGYLTACPTNVGTGLRASVMLHLPGFVIANQMEQVIRMVNQVGMAVRGLFGEGSDATGSIFQISNQQTLGESEEEIIGRLNNILDALIEKEQLARQKLIAEESQKIFDKIGRAYGILQNGHLLSSDEAMNHLSLLRLAVDLHMLPEDCRGPVDRLFIESQPGHIQHRARREITSSDRDILRASQLREQFASLPHLTYNLDN